jgi:hypothetical protein
MILLVVFHAKYAAEPKAGITDAIRIALIIRNEVDLLQTSSLRVRVFGRKTYGKHEASTPLVLDTIPGSMIRRSGKRLALW